jgi:sulfur-oxidizing protein SoxZ
MSWTDARALINVPRQAKRGEVIEIRTLVQHPMETGFRPLPGGGMVPRSIIKRFECVYDGAVIFGADLHPAIAANPYLAFKTVATASGAIVLRWIDDRDEVREERVTITVT